MSRLGWAQLNRLGAQFGKPANGQRADHYGYTRCCRSLVHNCVISSKLTPSTAYSPGTAASARPLPHRRPSRPAADTIAYPAWLARQNWRWRLAARPAAVDVEGLSGDVAGGVGGQ